MQKRRLVKLLLLLPFLGLLLPQTYARVEPTLFGFPFFYWYQLVWVLGGSLVVALVAALER